jgi:pilus assembly protein Flp/PilA
VRYGAGARWFGKVEKLIGMTKSIGPRSFYWSGKPEVMRTMSKLLRLVWRDRRGATAIEYGLLAAMAALAIVGFTTLGGSLGSQHDGVAAKAAAAMQ